MKDFARKQVEKDDAMEALDWICKMASRWTKYQNDQYDIWMKEKYATVKKFIEEHGDE